MGERRWRASQRAGLTEIGAIVKQTQDNELLRDALIENLHRQQLDPLEEAAAYQQLLDDFGATHEQLARGSAAPGRTSATPSGCSTCPRPCRSGSRPACSAPVTPAPCSA